MAAKQSRSRPGPSSESAPLWNAVLVVGAIALAGYVLVVRGALSWPPHELTGSIGIVAGCLTLIGPLVLWGRRGEAGASLGDHAWMTCGVAAWLFALARWSIGGAPSLDWTAPVAPWVIGGVAASTACSGWRIAGLRPAWTWTGVLGASLAVYWVVAGLAECIGRGASGYGLTRPGLFSWISRS